MKAQASLAALLGAALLLGGCDQALDKAVNQAAAGFLKASLVETCADDKACAEAVGSQFDTCQEKYTSEWDAYLDAGTSTQDKLLEDYSVKMYACIVDDEGAPYFTFAPDQ